MATEAPGAARLRESVERSRTLGSLRRIADAAGDSRLAAMATWLVHATRHSVLYRWLTAEPEPEVIVIDLRDTFTVGPIVALLDRLVAALTPSWRSSGLKRATDAFVALVDAAADTKTGRTIMKLLEPPEPTKGRDERE